MKLCLISWGSSARKTGICYQNGNPQSVNPRLLAGNHSPKFTPQSHCPSFTLSVSESHQISSDYVNQVRSLVNDTARLSHRTPTKTKKRTQLFPKVAVQDAQEASWRSNITWTAEVARSSLPASLVARKIHSHCGNF